MADGTDGAGAGYGFGSNRFFGTAGAGFNVFDGTDGKQFAINTLFGTQFSVGARQNIAVCPIGQYDLGFGPNADPVTFQMHTLSGGGRVGIVTSNSERFNVVPTAGVSLVRSGLHASYGFLGLNQTVWDTYGVANAGVGLRFNNNRMSVVPAVSFPLGLDGADPWFGVTFTSAF